MVCFRPDAGVPVLDLETETDLFLPTNPAFPGAGPYLTAQQPDSAGLRLWEIAGTAHADDYLSNLGPGDTAVGFLRPADAYQLITVAAQSGIGG